MNRRRVERRAVAGRAKRAHLNMIENMVLFTALVLIAAGAVVVVMIAVPASLAPSTPVEPT